MRLMNHQLLIRTICEQRGSTANARTFNTWLLDLDWCLDALRYRLMMISAQLTAELIELKQQILHCPACTVYYRTIDIDSLLDSNHSHNVCKYCKGALEHVDNSL